MEKKNEQPILIVGMPRSGTKLLRDLINNCPEISIPPAESIFIPALAQSFGSEDFRLTPNQLDRIYAFLAKSAFFWNMSQEGIVLDRDEFFRIIPPGASFFEMIAAVLKYYAFALNPDASIYGDKSPYYRGFLPLLKRIFPKGRIIHIIRDPRDVAVSTRNAWGRSLLRAAQDWNDQIQITRQAGRQFPSDYLEIRFEDLLSDPDGTLSGVFRFLALPYKKEYSQLSRPSEDLGAAKGVTVILRENTGKFKDQISPALVRRINQIVYPTAVELGYLEEGAEEHKPLSRFLRIFYKYYDAVQSLFFHMRHKGVITGMRYALKLKRVRV